MGFSWTTLFFGCLPALFRGDLKCFFIMLVLGVVTIGVSWFVFPFVYNKIHIKDLLAKGFIPADDSSKSILQGRGLVFAA